VCETFVKAAAVLDQRKSEGQDSFANGGRRKMPSSAVHTFTDPSDYATAIRATTIEMTVIGRGHFAAKRTRVDLHRLWMQRLFENLPRVVHSAFVARARHRHLPHAPWTTPALERCGIAAEQHHTTQRG
jgi:hypothetical protein